MSTAANNRRSSHVTYSASTQNQSQSTANEQKPPVRKSRRGRTSKIVRVSVGKVKNSLEDAVKKVMTAASDASQAAELWKKRMAKTAKAKKEQTNRYTVTISRNDRLSAPTTADLSSAEVARLMSNVWKNRNNNVRNDKVSRRAFVIKSTRGSMKKVPLQTHLSQRYSFVTKAIVGEDNDGAHEFASGPYIEDVKLDKRKDSKSENKPVLSIILSNGNRNDAQKHRNVLSRRFIKVLPFPLRTIAKRQVAV